MADNDVLRISISVDPVKDGKYAFPGRQANHSIVLDGRALKPEDWDQVPDIVRALIRTVGSAP